MQQIDQLAARRHSQRLSDDLSADAVQRSFFLIYDKLGLRLICFEVPVGVDHTLGASKNPANFLQQTGSRRIIWAINLRHERLENGRTWRHFRYRHSRTVLLGNFRDAWANSFRNVVALS